MNLIIKDIPREFLALKINYCRQQIAALPEVKMHTYTIDGTPVEYAVAGSTRLRTNTKQGKKLLNKMKIRDYLKHQLHVYEAIWEANYYGDPIPECRPRKTFRKLYVDYAQPVILDKAYFDSLESDSNSNYSKPTEYFFNGIYYRSAAERDIAIFYTEMGIPFKYEPAVYIKGLAEPIHPDFVLYIRELNNCKFHEHFGVKQSSSYLRKTRFKYDNYTNAGLVPEIDIIFTHDTTDLNFDIRALALKLNTAVYMTLVGTSKKDDEAA